MSLAQGVSQVDHLVVVAASLEQGVQWCEATLGVLPGPGGEHRHMGTHNRLLRMDSAAFASCYLEVIAINPLASAPPQARWFGMDTPALQAAVARQPQLVQAVVRCSGIEHHLRALKGLGIDAGPAVAANRSTPTGLLSWRIAIRSDGVMPLQGACPTLIEWEGEHPTERMAPSAVGLLSLAVGGLGEAALQALGVQGLKSSAQQGWQAELATPRGAVRLASFVHW